MELSCSRAAAGMGLDAGSELVYGVECRWQGRSRWTVAHCNGGDTGIWGEERGLIKASIDAQIHLMHKLLVSLTAWWKRPSAMIIHHSRIVSEPNGETLSRIIRNEYIYAS